MKIPFGSRKPNEKEAESLTKLGFNLNEINQQGRYYFLEVPNDPRIQVKEHNPAFDRREITISFNSIEVIIINQKTALYDAWVMFHIDNDKLKEALLKTDTIPEKAPELTEFQKKLANRLTQLEFIIFEDGAQRGYGKMIGTQFPYLKKLKEENPDEHDKLIVSNERYKKLYEMFPNWSDPKNLQGKYESMDVGPFMAMTANNYDGTQERSDCRIM